jgi:hypothetical protein
MVRIEKKELDFSMKIIITEQQLGSVLDSMLDEIFKGYEVVYKDNGRNIYVNGKLLAILEPTKGSISSNIYHDLKDNLFYDSDKDLKLAISNWVDKTFGVKKGTFKYGITFKKLEGDEKDLPKKPRKPHHATRQDKLEPGFDLKGFKERTNNIETKIKNKEDLIRVAREKQNPNSFANWMKREIKKDLEREKREKDWMKVNKTLEDIKNAKIK